MLINIPWGWEFSGDPTSWTEHSHLRGSGPTSGQRTKILQAVLCIKQKNKKKKKKGKESKQTNKTKSK